MTTTKLNKTKAFAKKLRAASCSTTRFTCSSAVGYGVIIATGLVFGTAAGTVVKNVTAE